MHSLLHLVDQDNAPVNPEIRIAVEAAYRWSIRDYRGIDESELATMAEKVALSMSKRLDEIQSPRRYAFAALTGRIEEWFRQHPVKMVSFESDDEFDRAVGPDHRFAREMEGKLLFAQIRRHLNERDRQICILLEHGMDRPREIAKVLGFSNKAAHMALQRTKKKMASIGMVESPGASGGLRCDMKTAKPRPLLGSVSTSGTGWEAQRGSAPLEAKSFATKSGHSVERGTFASPGARER